MDNVPSMRSFLTLYWQADCQAHRLDCLTSTSILEFGTSGFLRTLYVDSSCIRFRLKLNTEY
jgi:hypothetical protein